MFFQGYKWKPGDEKETWEVGREIFTLETRMAQP
jgi:hypothetical protein